MTSAWVAFGSPSSHFQDSVVGLDLQSQPTVPEASSDRQCGGGPVFLACGCYDPLLLRCAWWSFSPGWLLNFSLQRIHVMTLLTWTLDLSVFNTPPGYWLWRHDPWMCLCCLGVPVPCYVTPCLSTSTSRHPCQWYESCYVCVQVMYLLDMLFSFKNKY